MHPEVVSDKPGMCHKCGMDLVEKDKKENHMEHAAKPGMLYTCPMDPDVIQDTPGNCPKCGMKLVPMTSTKKEGHEHHASMEHDFRRRFFVTLPFVLLSMLLSPNIQKWLGV